MFELSQDEGEFLIELARRAVEEYLKTKERIKAPKVQDKLLQPCGVFVTLNTCEKGEKSLRGCIGLPYPTEPLIEAVIESAINAGTQDPRFPPVSLRELNQLVFEISVLTPPQTIEVKNPQDYRNQIRVGEDGLIVERGYNKGLLLPQVPVEWEWDEETFLCQCCIKAGLTPDSWLIKGTKVHKFSCIIVKETSPNGDVEIVDMRKTEAKTD